MISDDCNINYESRSYLDGEYELLKGIEKNIDNDELDLISKNLKSFLKNNDKSVIVVTNNKRFLN